MYNREQKQAKKDDRFEGDRIGIEIRANFANRNRKKINKFCDKMAKKMW